MFEGHAPYRPRYLLPDYEPALAQGSEHLELDPPENIDTLLLPFAEDISDEDLREKICLLWISLDRILPDGFVHANIGPQDNRVLRAMLNVDREVKQIVPNLRLTVV